MPGDAGGVSGGLLTKSEVRSLKSEVRSIISRRIRPCDVVVIEANVVRLRSRMGLLKGVARVDSKPKTKSECTEETV